MVKINPDKNFILMTRADTLITQITITDSDGNEYVPEQTDTLRFALKKDYNDKRVLINKQIPIDTLTLRLDSEDTKGLSQPEVYVYDIELTYGDNCVATITSGKLKIVPEVL